MHSSRRSSVSTASVLDNLRRIVRALRVSAHAVERDLGISGAQLFVLHTVAEEPGLSLRALSERTLTDPSSVSVVVARLAARGLVRRRRDPSDRRRDVLSLTPRGTKLLEAAPPPIQGRLIAALSALPRKRLEQFDTTLAELVGAIGAARGSAPMFFDEEPKRKARQ